MADKPDFSHFVMALAASFSTALFIWYLQSRTSETISANIEEPRSVVRKEE